MIEERRPWGRAILWIVVLGTWEVLVRIYAVPQFVLPGPSAIGNALIADFPSLMASLWTTLRITVLAFMLAAVSGIALAILFSQSRVIEMMLYPYAVVLQVTLWSYPYCREGDF